MSAGKNPGENPGLERLANTGRPPGNPGNSGGKKGRSGRPPNEFRERMRELASTAQAEKYLRKCLRGEFGPKFFLQALQFATDRGYGKAPQPITGEDGGPLQLEDVTPLTDEERAARLLAIVERARVRKEAAE